MASVLKVDKLDPQSGTALEIGTSGDTITVPSGATFAVSGTMNASSITAGTLAIARGGTGAATLAAAGLADTPSFRVEKNGDQTIGTGAWTKVVTYTETWDTDSAYASDKFTVPSGGAGKYYIHWFFSIASVDDQKRIVAKLYYNGVGDAKTYTQGVASKDGLTQYAAGSTVRALADGDYIEMYVYQDTGTDATLQGSSNHWEAFRLIGV
jgi:hypothetical protein